MQISSNHKIRNRARDRLRLTPNRLVTIAGASSAIVLVLLAFFALSPIISPDSNALTNTTAYAESRVAVQAAASVSLSLDQNVEIPVTPSSSGTFGMNSAKLKVATNNEEGYKIFLTTSNGKSTLTNTDINKTGTGYEIDSITSDTVGTAFTGNTWGYALSDSELSASSTYKAVPTSLTSIYNKTTASVGGEDNYNLAFGTHISTSLAAGEYSNSVIVSVVANPQTISTLSELVYMQDMNSNICSNTASAYKGEGVDPDRTSPYYLNPVTKQLIDVRDGKRYWVAKLADGNCWMTQNLALDLDPAKPLTPSDSDVSSNWAPVGKTRTDYSSMSVAEAKTTSWNFGKWVLNNPTTSDWKSSGCNEPSDDERFIMGSCNLYSNVEGYTESNNGWNETASVNSANKTYDAHYLVGNYYSLGAAVAESLDALQEESTKITLASGGPYLEAPESICPKGWKLATSGRGFPPLRAIPSEWLSLLKAYGYPDESNKGNDLTTQWSTNTAVPYTTVAGGSKRRADYAPIYLVRTGTIYTNISSDETKTEDIYMKFLGGGSYLSSTIFPETTNDFFFVTITLDNITTGGSYSGGRNGGRAVRCLSR